jgi:hypothetical protein
MIADLKRSNVITLSNESSRNLRSAVIAGIYFLLVSR